MYYNFYSQFLNNEKITMIPFIQFPLKDSDKTYIWKTTDRMDQISNKFYGTPYGGKLILLANATLGTNEDEIPDGAILTIPYPFKDGLQRWINIVDKFKNYY